MLPFFFEELFTFDPSLSVVPKKAALTHCKTQCFKTPGKETKRKHYVLNGESNLWLQITEQVAIPKMYMELAAKILINCNILGNINIYFTVMWVRILRNMFSFLLVNQRT